MNNIYADLLCDTDNEPKPRGKTTREVIEPPTFTIALLNPAYDPQMKAARLECVLQAYRNLTPEQQANVREELAELDIELQTGVTEEQDARNSREFPY